MSQIDVYDSRLKLELSDEAIQAFQRDGAICLRGTFAPWIDQMRAAAERVMAAPQSSVFNYEKAASSNTSFFLTMNMWDYDPEFRSFIFDTPAAELAGRMMRSSNTYFFKDQLFVKEPHSEMPTPWHHDLPYWCVDGSQVCTTWIALDHANEDNGAVKYIRGSHRWADLYQPRDFSGEGGQRNPDLPLVPDIDAAHDQYDILMFEMEPGDVTIFHARTLHGGAGNHTSQFRRGLSLRWMGDDARYTPSRPGCSKPFKDPRLADGDLISKGSAVFPKAWRIASRDR